MSSVNGVGGAFIFSADPKSLARWYWETLGIEFEGDGTGEMFYKVYLALDPRDTARTFDTTFAILKAKIPLTQRVPEVEPQSMYGDQPFMVNLRVDDLGALLAQLEANGIPILGREDLAYGKFAWIRDLDGNRVELYQPLAG